MMVLGSCTNPISVPVTSAAKRSSCQCFCDPVYTHSTGSGAFWPVSNSTSPAATLVVRSPSFLATTMSTRGPETRFWLNCR